VQPRHDINSVYPAQGATRWVYNNSIPNANGTTVSSQSVQHFTFVTPVGSTGANQCGRVIFSDFHVNNLNPGSARPFPKACTSGPMSGNDRIMEYMLFDPGACVQPDTNSVAPPAGCTPRYACNGDCGLQVSDGCGGTINCGTCPLPNPYAALTINPVAGS